MLDRMNTWLFQGNRDFFDLDRYFGAGFDRVTWSVKRHGSEMRPGDVVYFWRAKGKNKDIRGIVASAVIDSDVWEGPDHPEAISLYKEEHRAAATAAAPRVWLRLDKVATKKEVIKADWLKGDPVCSDLLVLRQRTGTNYRVPEHHAARLAGLWDRTGQSWTRPESASALLVYEELRGAPVSKQPGSPVADLALRVGRSVGAAYNKVMNFRAIDPRDSRAGMSGAGSTDRKVWDEFFDPAVGEVRVDALRASVDGL